MAKYTKSFFTDGTVVMKITKYGEKSKTERFALSQLITQALITIPETTTLMRVL
jgi:hypothetical protein